MGRLLIRWLLGASRPATPPPATRIDCVGTVLAPGFALDRLGADHPAPRKLSPAEAERCFGVIQGK